MYVTLRTKPAPPPPPVRGREQDWRSLTDLDRATLELWLIGDPIVLTPPQAAFVRRYES